MRMLGPSDPPISPHPGPQQMPFYNIEMSGSCPFPESKHRPPMLAVVDRKCLQQLTFYTVREHKQQQQQQQQQQQ